MKEKNNRGTVLPLSFKIRTLILVEACRTTNRLSFIFHQIQIKYVSNIKEELSSFEMERSPEVIHLIELKKTTTARGIDLNPPLIFTFLQLTIARLRKPGKIVLYLSKLIRIDNRPHPPPPTPHPTSRKSSLGRIKDRTRETADIEPGHTPNCLC